MYKPKIIFFSDSELLEGPRWDKKRNVLFCVSILNNLIYQFNPLTGEIQSYKTDGPVGAVAIKENGELISAELGGIYQISPKTGEKKFVTQIITEKNIRYNDGILDKKERFLIGTMFYQRYEEGRGKLYSFDGHTVSTLVTGTTISNGIGFSNNQKYMYFIDTPMRKIARYYYDIETGKAIFDRYIIHIQDVGNPDGMCVDIDDTVWIAQWGGFKVSHWNPYTGEKIGEIKLPCKNVSSCCIGGKDMDTLFITTAKHDDGTESEELSGGLFQVKIR